MQRRAVRRVAGGGAAAAAVWRCGLLGRGEAGAELELLDPELDVVADLGVGGGGGGCQGFLFVFGGVGVLRGLGLGLGLGWKGWVGRGGQGWGGVECTVGGWGWWSVSGRQKGTLLRAN